MRAHTHTQTHTHTNTHKHTNTHTHKHTHTHAHSAQHTHTHAHTHTHTHTRKRTHAHHIICVDVFDCSKWYRVSQSVSLCAVCPHRHIMLALTSVAPTNASTSMSSPSTGAGNAEPDAADGTGTIAIVCRSKCEACTRTTCLIS
jgi:hypothetical protein